MPIERLDGALADRVHGLGRGDEDEVVAGHVAQEVSGRALLGEDLAQQIARLADHAVGLREAVVVVVGLEVVEVEVAEGERLARR